MAFDAFAVKLFFSDEVPFSILLLADSTITMIKGLFKYLMRSRIK